MDNAKNPFERTESRKSHAWWWESHINPRNAKWLTSSLDEMERNTEHMVKLIEDDGDSLAKKAEMYYQRRPELIGQVHEFQRMYRILAERYKQLTGDLHANLSDMNLLAPVAPDSDSEPSTPRFNTDVKLNPFKSTHRAAGFNVFLRSVSDRSPREVSPAPDSEESDFHNYPRSPLLPEKLIPMDAELDNEKEKTGMANPGFVELQLKIAGYEVEIGNLKMELENARSSNSKSKIDEQEVDAEQIQEEDEDNSDPEKVRAVFEELKLTKGRLYNLEMQNERLSTENKLAHENIRQLQDQLKEAQKDAAVLRSKFDTEIRKSSKRAEKMMRLTNENDQVREELIELERHCHALEIQKAGVEKNLSEEIKQLKIELSEKRDRLEDLKLTYESFISERDELIAEAGLSKELKLQVERQRELVLEAEEEKREAIRQLCFSLEHYRKGYEQLREAFTEHRGLPVLIAS